MIDELLTAGAQAYREALRVQAVREAREKHRAELAALADPHEYDPRPAPLDEAMYKGTGIGFLFGFDDDPKRDAWYARELGDWKVVGLGN